MKTRRQLEKAIAKAKDNYAAAVKYETPLITRCEDHPRTMTAALRAAERTNECIRELSCLREQLAALDDGPTADPYEC